YTSRFFYRLSGALRVLHSFPTRRSSDLPFQRRINKQITAQRDPTQQTGQQVDRNGQMNQAGGRTQAAKDENGVRAQPPRRQRPRSEEHTSELQSPCNLVCRLLLEKKNKA